METVGHILRTEREKKLLSIKDIEAATSIRALYIKAIEEDNFSIIPGEVYVKGFIRNYATYLELNPERVMEIYRQMHASTNAKGEAVAAASMEMEKQESSSEVTSQPQNSLLKWLMMGTVAIGLTGGIIWWLTANNQPAPLPLKQQAKNTPVVPSSPQTVIPSNPTPPASVPAAKPVVITAKFTDNCWISVSADGKEIYEGTPKVGESLTWEAQSAITLKAGNAGAIEMTYNGQSVGKLGEPGEVILKTFSANTIKKP